MSGTAQAQANIHNGGVTLNTAQNSSSSASGTLTNRGSDTAAGTLPYNSARFNFAYSVASTGNWAGGIQYQTQGGKPMIWVQPANVTFPNATSNGTDFASYTMTFTRGVLGLTFRIGGLDFRDGLRLQFLNNGTLLNINSSWVTANVPNGTNVLAVSSISATQLRVASTNDNGASGDTSLNYVQFTVPAGTVVDEVRVLSAKENGLTSNNTIGFHDFNWLPEPINAVDDSASGINGQTGQANVIDVLGNDTLDNPDGAGVEAATLATVTITQLSTTQSGVTLNPTTGQVSVAAGTPPGTHVVTYRICQSNTAPANCDTATATVTVPAPQVDLSITKTNGTSQVFTGSTTTYTLTVTNNGPDPASGAVVTDLPGAGIACDAAASVSITGAGVPAGTFTFADLAGAGIALGTLSNGQSATLSYSCQVN